MPRRPQSVPAPRALQAKPSAGRESQAQSEAIAPAESVEGTLRKHSSPAAGLLGNWPSCWVRRIRQMPSHRDRTVRHVVMARREGRVYWSWRSEDLVPKVHDGTCEELARFWGPRGGARLRRGWRRMPSGHRHAESRRLQSRAPLGLLPHPNPGILVHKAFTLCRQHTGRFARNT